MAVAADDIDHGDLHIMAACIEYQPDIVVSSNYRDLSVLASRTRVMNPYEFARHIGLVGR